MAIIVRLLLCGLIISATAIPSRAEVACGVCFYLQEGWAASIVKEDSVECEIGLRPEQWVSMVESARWSEGEYAIRISVLRTNFDDAASRVGFVFERWGGSWWGVMDRGGIAPAEHVQYGPFMGWLSDGWFRGFAKEGAVFANQSHLYSGIWRTMLLRLSDDLFFGLQHSRWNPDIDLDRDCVAEEILTSLKIGA